jgi:hypothetical protein
MSGTPLVPILRRFSSLPIESWPKGYSNPSVRRTLFLGTKVWTAGTTGRILIFHCHWGVIWMGGTLRDCCQTALRPFFLALLLTVAWLAWAACSANASSENPNPLGSLEQATVSLLHKTGSTLPPAIKDVPAPVAAVRETGDGTAAAVVDVVDPVAGQATEATGTAVNNAAPPQTDAVSTFVSDVDSLAPALPGVQAPSLPIPTLPIPTVPLPPLPVPTVPVPTVQGTQVPLPDVPGQLPEETVPGRSPVTTASPSGFDAVMEALAGLEATARSDSQAAKKAAVAPQQARRAVSPLEFLANTHTLRGMAATIGYVVSATPSPANAPEPEPAFRFVALQNQSGSASSGTGSAGAEASTDVAAFWSTRHDARSGLMPDAALILAAGPSFDPGSSPD